MFRGRPRKRRTFNFVPQNQEEEPAHSSSSAPLTSNACTLKTSFDRTVESTTDPVLENTLLNDEDPSITVMCPSRASKVRCVQKMSTIQRTALLEEKETMRQRASLRVATESPELKEHRLADLRNRASQRLSTESNEEREKRLADQRKRTSEKLSAESNEEREKRLADLRKRASETLSTESNEEREKRLADLRKRASETLSAESNEEREKRLANLRKRASQRLSTESNEEREKRLADQRKRTSETLSVESNEEREKRLANLRKRASQRLSTETEEQKEKRLKSLCSRSRLRFVSENTELRKQRLEEQRRRNTRRRKALEGNRPKTYKSAVEAEVTYQNLGNFDVACFHCGALHFPEERVSNRINCNSFGDCCLHGRVELESFLFPNELVNLFLRRHPLATEFHKRIRNLNASFAFASFNLEDDRTINSHGIYSFTVCGQIYHKINVAAHPTQNTQGDFERPQYGQLYFLDPDDALHERLDYPLNYGINPRLMELLEHIMRSFNRYAQGFMTMREVEEEVNQQAIGEGIDPPRVQLLFMPPNEIDFNRFNVPSCNEVCAVFTLNADQSFPENEMVIRQRGKEIIRLKNIDQRVEPFTYPLFYPQGTSGFHIDVKLQTPYISRERITRLEFAQYRLAFRPKLTKYLATEADSAVTDLREINFNALHFGGRLFQQYLVDTYIRVERDRIQWIKNNQNKIRSDQYLEVNRYLKELSEKKNATIGEKVILPSSFPGSSRYYTEHFEDAMAIVRRFGSPDFFITITSNPNWPEIKEACRIKFEDGTSLSLTAQDRPDLVTRVAKLKFDKIIEDLDKKQVFGKVAAFVYTIEFQKRGLPHMHLLLIMRPEDKIHKPEELDDLISAEIPDNDDEYLRELVIKWMIHNPCGELNKNATCMVNKKGKIKCRFNFPKSFQESTTLEENAKPNYRRRYIPKLDPQNPQFSHELAIYRKDASGHLITRDNRNVAPYNAYLLKKYNCHINVEYVGSILAVKYLYKYIYKGHDCASIKVVEEKSKIIYNEATTYIEGRCITPPEACWRLFGNEIQKKSHSVQRLNIHLPGQYKITNLDQAQEDLADIGQKGSTLEAYFKHNNAVKQKENIVQLDRNLEEKGAYYYYWQMPEHYKWDGQSSKWVERMRKSNVIGRIHNVNFVTHPELYHLRLLLYHVKDAISFEDLLTVNSIRYATYKQACLARGLTYDDKQWIESLHESALSKMPRVMRTLFCQILILGSPENPKRLWEMFKEHLAQDFIQEALRTQNSVEEAIKRAYRIIAYKLNTEGGEGRNFQHWIKKFGFENTDSYTSEVNKDILNIDDSAALGKSFYELLKGKQIEIVDVILNAVNEATFGPKCFFIDGPGGTGKTFIYKTLYHLLRGRNHNVKCMAFTGIASILLPDGQTSHKTFGLKVPLTADSDSSIKTPSPKALELEKIDVFLMDEAPMLPKYGLNIMDKFLRKIGNSNLPFGGKTIVLGGDFRQCLPVLPRANKNELLDLSIKKSDLWSKFKLLSLNENIRLDIEQKEFAEYLVNLGNGDLPVNSMGEIELPHEILSAGNLILEVFENCITDGNYEGMKDRAILAPLNKDVYTINDNIISKLPGEYKIYHSYDSVKDQQDEAFTFTPEFLNSVEIADLPPHELKLKKNAIIMLLRNLDIAEGLCNGTRLITTELCDNIIKAKIITGERSGQEVHIPRITLDSVKGHLGCTMQRHQFPVRAAFAITVHKAQGQTFDFVGVDLRTPVFMHGMLYVAFSRVKRKSCLKVLLPSENPCHTRNIVWKEILNNTINM